MKKHQGFTLIELLIVIVIIAILAGIIYVAVDPATRFKQARNAERWSSVNAILNAYLKYAVDNDGDDPANPTLVDNTKYMIGTGADYADHPHFLPGSGDHSRLRPHLVWRHHRHGGRHGRHYPAGRYERLHRQGHCQDRATGNHI